MRKRFAQLKKISFAWKDDSVLKLLYDPVITVLMIDVLGRLFNHAFLIQWLFVYTVIIYRGKLHFV